MIKKLLLALALLVSPALATVTQLTGTLTDASGSTISGTGCFKLPVNAIDTSTNRALSPMQLCFPLNNGVFPAFASVVPNDVMQPAKTFYQFTAKDTTGKLVFMANYVIPTGSGTFNMGLAIPTLVTTSQISYISPASTSSSNVFCCTQTFQGQIVSTLGTGTAPFSITSTTLVGNLNVNLLNGVTISGTPGTGQVITATSSSTANWQNVNATPFVSYTNDGVTGTSAGLIAKLSGAPAVAVTAGLSDQNGAIGICVTGCGIGGTGSFTTVGTASCIFDGATTAGDYVQVSSTGAGKCHDAGASFPATNQVIGRVLSTNAGTGTFSMAVFSPEIAKTAATTIPPAVTASSITLASGTAVSSGVTTAVITKAVTMPSSGCPCRAFVAYGLNLSTGNSGIVNAWVNDGTNNAATSQVLVTGSASAYGISGSSFTSGTFANNAVVTFNLNVNPSNSGGISVLTTPSQGGQNSWMNVAIFTSN